MQKKQKFIKHYQDGFMPWAHEQPDFNLVEMVDNWPIKPCSTLEPGCGTGTDSIWLSQQGFKTTAFDGSPIAIDIAQKNGMKQNAKVDFRVVDFLTENLAPSKYEFVFDRGFFHCFYLLKERREIAKRVSRVLKKDGLWLSLIGNADGVKTDPGPPLHSAEQIVKSVEPFFKILSIRASHFGNEEENPARIWVCLMRKRN